MLRSHTLFRLTIRRDRAKGAFDLTELALYLVAGILLLIGIIALFENVFGSTKSQTAQTQFNSVVTEVRSLYGNQPSYTGLTTATIANSGAMAAAWVDSPPPNATEIINPFQGNFTIAPASTGTGTDNAFTVEDAGLPETACVALATQDEGSSLVSVTVNGGTASTTPMTVADAQTACDTTGNTNDVTVELQ